MPHAQTDRVNTVTEGWERIERWFAENAPSLLGGLHPPATPEEIRETETRLGVTFPLDFRESVLRHNGTAPQSWTAGKLLNLEEIEERWLMLNKILDQGYFDDRHQRVEEDVWIQKNWWARGWMPFTEAIDSNYCIDFVPTIAGKSGQIIHMDHELNRRPRTAHSFSEYLKMQVDKLEDDKYVLYEGGLWLKWDIL
jgi:cell wall assembly regulator SMI1